MALGDFVEKVKQAFGSAASDHGETIDESTNRVANAKDATQGDDHYRASMYDAKENTGDAAMNAGGQRPSVPGERT